MIDKAPGSPPTSAFGLLDTDTRPYFERLLRLASSLCETPMAQLALLEGAQLCTKAQLNWPLEGGTLGPQLSQDLLEQHTEPDLSQDPVWAQHPWVRPVDGLRFLASTPLLNANGQCLGVLMVGDRQVRQVSAQGLESLEALAAQALLLLEFGRQQSRLLDAEAQSEQALQRQNLQAEARRIAGQVAQVGGWILRLPDQQFAWTSEVALIHGLDPQAQVSPAQAFAAYSPEDQPRLSAAYQDCVRLGQRFDLELQLRRPDQQQLWVRVIGEAVRDEQGQVVAVQGALENIDERKRNEEALRESEERFRLAARATADAVWDWNIDTDAMWWSDSLSSLFGIDLQSLESDSRSWTSRIHPDDSARVLDSLQRLLTSTGTQWSEEYRFRRADGSHAPVLDRGFLIRDPRGLPRRMVGGLKDLTEQRRARDEAQRDLQTRMSIVRIQQEIATADLNLEGVLALMAERARELTHADGSSVELLEKHETVCRAASGILHLRVGNRLGLQDTLSGLVLRQNLTVRCHDTEQDPRVNVNVSRHLGVRSVIVAPLLSDDQAIGVMRVVSATPNAFTLHDETNLQILVATLGGVIQRHRLGAQLQASEAQYRLLFDLNPQPMWVHDVPNLRMLAANKAMLEHYGYDAERLRQMKASDFWVDEDNDSHQSKLASIVLGEMQRDARRRHLRQDGSQIDVEVTANTITFNGQPARLVIASDVTERLRTERDLLRVSRAQRLLSACNEALVRANTEIGLLQDVARITVEIGGYHMTWIGYIEDDDPGRWIRPVARHGKGTAFLDQIKVSWAEDSPQGQGPAGLALRDGRMVIIADLRTDERYAPWLATALPYGLRGLVCLPLHIGPRRFGLFSLYSSEVFHISDDEVQLLQALAKDLAFGISNLRAREEQNRLQHAVLKLATAVSASTGTEFFEQLVRNMTDALGAQAGFVLSLEAGQPTQARLIAGQVSGRACSGAKLSLADTPFETLLRDGNWLVRTDLPPLPGLPPVDGAQSLVGRRLDNAAGEPMGLVCALFTRALTQTGFTVSALHIFASRAAAELARQAADTQIRDQASLLDRAQDAILVHRLSGGLVYWNQGAERLYGFTAQEALDPVQGERIERECLHFQLANSPVLQDGEWTGEIEQHRKDGSALTVESRWTLVRDAFGLAESILSINTDVTARKHAEQEIQRLAFFDALTELPNRQLLMDRLQHALASSTRTGAGGALLFIDLDNFKTLNDTLGHDQGDELLRQVAQRLLMCVRETDTVARLGGDEFVVMLENLGNATPEVVEHAKRIGDKVLATLGMPFLLAGHQHESSCSIGVAPFMDGHKGISDLLKQADLAMYQAKTAGRNTLRFFDPVMQAEVSARAALEAALRQALARGEFLLHYQPQTEQGQQVSGVEALVRWRHPVHGMVSPADFIPLAEDTGLIIPLGRWVLDTACNLLASWARFPSHAHLSVAVNVSSRQFKHPDFVEDVVSALQQSGARPDRLKLELTESLLVDDMESIIERMGVLKALGVGFSLDDFGTGYSSLSYLKRLPLDQLKIDQSFVRDVLTDPNDAAIVRTIITLGRSLGLAVIAEGVESSAQQDFLASHDCHAFQGYAFGKPMAAAELQTFLHQHSVH
ncbi:EAL domain-containing protein [Curvibacter sp. HBC28]|uniref:EAL domain-containing protein n=1 Tax=Curvibacter microcysteis TaxID=3026419 RepID=A0ABT5MFL3_9BURK|nr:EAL domain-containing protein [Curvibacter sp. HBC28]MDD0813960.1 EAL domain-containing protein [Curvibacter sp. HBC28]